MDSQIPDFNPTTYSLVNADELIADSKARNLRLQFSDKRSQNPLSSASYLGVEEDTTPASITCNNPHCIANST